METKKTRWSKDEMELMKNTFSGEKGEDLLVLVRDVLFQFSEEVPELNEGVLAIIKKMMMPDLDKNLPIGFQADVTNSLAGSQETAGIKDLHPEVAMIHIKANDLVKKYLSQRMMALSGDEVAFPISLIEMKNGLNKTDDERLISMLAYLFLESGYIEASLIAIRNHANHKEETEEEKAEKAKANSSK